MSQLTCVSFGNNNLTSVDVSGDSRLYGLYCRNSGISSLNIANTVTLTILDCEDNYLNISDIIYDINIIQTQENASVSYINQKLVLYNYTITWNVNGGSPAPTQTTVTQNNSINAPVAMTKAGYTFGGWYADATFMQKVTFPVNNVTSDKTFYAKWIGNTQISAGGNHTIMLKPDGTLWSWGSNDSGQLGDGTNTNSANPVQVQQD